MYIQFKWAKSGARFTEFQHTSKMDNYIVICAIMKVITDLIYFT